MVQSSQSDDSSDGDKDDCSFASESPEDCPGRWAAELVVAVADQSMDKESAAILFGNRDRSTSESSDTSDGSSSSGSSSSTSMDGLSRSPVGFWTVRPGSSSIEDATDGDDEPICWTPSLQSSSHPSPAIDALSLNDDKGMGGPPHILSPSGFSTSNLGRLLDESSGAATAALALDESSHPSSNADDEFGPITSIVADDTAAASDTMGSCVPSFRPAVKKMSRSISYSAFSTYNTGVGLTMPKTESKPKLFQSTAVRTSLSSTHQNDLFRTYFVKFVDLLVERETERLVHGKEKV